MIRLAICGTDEPSARLWTARIRGAVLTPLNEAEAVVVESWVAGVETAEQSLLSGRHVLLPAGACGSVEALDRLFAAAKRGGRQLAVANPERYVPSRRLVKEQLDSGKLGKVGLLRIHRWETSPGQFDDPNQVPLGWPLDLDLALWLAGCLPETIFASGRDDFYQFVQIHLGFADGAMALVDYTPRHPEGMPYRSLSVIGSNGSASADDLQNFGLLYWGHRPQATLIDELRPLTVVALLQEFVTGLNADRDFTPSVESWRHALVATRAVRQSLETRQVVRLERA